MDTSGEMPARHLRTTLQPFALLSLDAHWIRANIPLGQEALRGVAIQPRRAANISSAAARLVPSLAFASPSDLAFHQMHISDDNPRESRTLIPNLYVL